MQQSSEAPSNSGERSTLEECDSNPLFVAQNIQILAEKLFGPPKICFKYA